MAEPRVLTEKQVEQLAARMPITIQHAAWSAAYDAIEAIRDLTHTIKHLREENQRLHALIANEHGQLGVDLNAVEELQRLRRQLGNAKVEWASDAPRFFVTMPFFTKDDVLTIVQAVRGAGGTAQVKARLVGDWYDAEGNEHG